MSDFALQLAGSSAARTLARAVGVHLPPSLDRETGPWAEQPLVDRPVVVLPGPDAHLADTLRASAARLGAPADPEAPWALVFDATGIVDVPGLRAVWEGLAPRLGALRRSGRVVVVGRPPEDTPDPRVRAARRALDGLVRSLARELGRSGATANLLTVPDGAEDRVHGVLHFLLSPRSAFVSGQPFPLSSSLPGAFAGVRPFDGRVVLVTGAARGIGEATARAFAREGATVLVHDHPGARAEAEAIAAELGGEAILADLALAEGRAALVGAVEARGRLDVLVQNAGVTRDKTLGRMPAELWDLVLAVNLDAVIDLAERLGPRLAEGGAMVCLSSIGGIGGNVGQTNYAATKAGVIGLVEATAPRLAARGVAVSAVAPGFIETRMTAAIPFATREVARRLSNVAQGGLPTDVAEVVTFLASPSGRALTGRVLRVCGGNLLGA